MDDGREIQKLQIETQLVVERLREVLPFSFHQVPFVHRDDHAAPRTLCFAGNRAVLIGRSKRRVDDQHDHIGIRDRAARGEDADRLDLTRSRNASGLS